MAIVSISEGAKLARKGRQTLYNHHEKGKLNFTETDDGKVGIDTSELHRVYGKLHISSPEQAETLALDKAMSKVETDGQTKTPKIDKRDKALQAEIDRVNELLDIEKTERKREREQAAETIDDLKTQREKWEKQAEQIQMLLTHEKENAMTKKRGLFGWLKG